MKRLLLCLFFMVSGYAQTGNIPSKEVVMSKVDSIRKAHHIPELGFAVVTENGPEILEVLGLHRNDDTEKATLDDRFHLGSNTKAITGYIAARWVEKGKIGWNTRFFDLFPDWKKEALPAYADITLADLLSHRAHIQPFTDGTEFDALPDFSGTPSQKRLAFTKWLLAAQPAIDTTQTYIYSNAGFAIAAVMLEKASGKPWEDLLAAEMKLLGAAPELSFPIKKHAGQPWGHDENLKPLGAGDPYIIPDIIAPAGDVNMTLPDYVKFIRENLKGLHGHSKFLTQKTFEYLHYGIPEYAIGWGWGFNKEKQKVSAHDGSGGTFYCQAFLVAETGVAYIIVANAATEDTTAGIMAVNIYLRNTAYKSLKQ